MQHKAKLQILTYSLYHPPAQKASILSIFFPGCSNRSQGYFVINPRQLFFPACGKFRLLFLYGSCIMLLMSGCRPVGEQAERCRWQKKRGERVAAVGEARVCTVRRSGCRAPQQEGRLLWEQVSSNNFISYPGVAQLVGRLLWELVVRPLSSDAKARKYEKNGAFASIR